MAKAPTKAQFKVILENEIKAWDKRLEDEKMKEQALGRKLECEWLLEVFCGKGGMNHVQKKKEIAQ